MSRTLLEQWKDIAYDESADRATLQRFWGTYFQIEKEIYEQLLSNPDEEVKGTVKELAEKYGQEVLTMVGFLDGIDESLKEPNPIETMDEDTVVKLLHLIKRSFIRTWLQQKLTGYMNFHSGKRFILRKS